MKLYKVSSPLHTWADNGDVMDAQIVWTGNQADARTNRIRLEAPFKEIKPAKRPKVAVDEIDVPTDKTGLLGWLNVNCV